MRWVGCGQEWSETFLLLGFSRKGFFSDVTNDSYGCKWELIADTLLLYCLVVYCQIIIPVLHSNILYSVVVCDMWKSSKSLTQTVFTWITAVSLYQILPIEISHVKYWLRKNSNVSFYWFFLLVSFPLMVHLILSQKLSWLCVCFLSVCWNMFISCRIIKWQLK